MDDLRFTCGLLLLALEIGQFDGAEVGAGRHLTKRTNPLIAPLLMKGVQGDQQANIENLETGFLVVATRAPLL